MLNSLWHIHYTKFFTTPTHDTTHHTGGHSQHYFAHRKDIIFHLKASLQATLTLAQIEVVTDYAGSGITIESMHARPEDVSQEARVYPSNTMPCDGIIGLPLMIP